MIFPVELLGVGIAHSGAHCKIHCQRGFQNYQGCILVGSHRDCEDHIAVCRYDPCSLALSLMTRATHHGSFRREQKGRPRSPRAFEGTRPPCSPRSFIFRLRGLHTYTLNHRGSGLPYWGWATASQVVSGAAISAKVSADTPKAKSFGKLR
jgi:hypothetical protein